MDPRTWTLTAWINFTASGIALVGAASWWADFVPAAHVATIHATALTATGLTNLLLGSKA